MRLAELIHYLEDLFPLSLQESYDNSGLLVGDKQKEVSSILFALDSTEEIVEEAIAKKCELIIVHHPIIFKGLKSLTGVNYIERTILKSIQNNIAIYAAHTNLDNFRYGVNDEIGARLGVKNRKILAPKPNHLVKLQTYVPIEFQEKVRAALFEAGAGQIGNYSECSFSHPGEGTFKANDEAKPFVGSAGVRHSEKEVKIELVLPQIKVKKVLAALQENHPYEEVAYDLIPLLNQNSEVGSGMIGELELEMSEKDFFEHLKKVFHCTVIRHTSWRNKKIKKVAWCGGSGSFLLSNAKAQQADVYITGDFKYHEFFDAENEIIIADIGHFESEQFTINLLADIITKKFPKFALHLTGINTNPIKYF